MSDTVVLERLSAARHMTAPVRDIERQRVYILPTRQGLLFMFLLLTMLLGAVNYNNSMAYLLTFLLASLLLVCLLHTWRNLAGLVIRTEPARPVFAGEVAYFPLLFDNRGGSERPSIDLGKHQHSFFKRSKPPAIMATSVSIQGDHMARHKYAVKTQQRGVLSPGRITVSTCYPLGLFRAWSNFRNERRCLVYPRPAGKMPLPDAALSKSQGEGGGKSGADDFVGFRHYRPGDSVRNIAWKALAREQPLLVKRFSGERGTQLILSWQQLAAFRHTETKLSQLCLWILQAREAGYDYGLDIPGVFIQPGQGDDHLHACLEALARFGTSNG